MTSQKNSLEMGTAGATITPANSTSVNDDPFYFVGINGTGAALVYDATRSAHGTQSAKITPVASNTASLQFGGSATAGQLGATTTLAARVYVYLTALTVAQMGVMFFNDSTSARLASVHLGSTGKLYVRDTTATIFFTATNAIPLNQWVRIEMRTKLGAAGTGELHFAYYLGDSTSAVESYDNTTTVAMGSGPYTSVSLGKLSNDSYATPFWVDDPAIAFPSTTFVGKYASTPATISAGSAITVEPGQTFLLTGTVVPGTDTIASRVWTLAGTQVSAGSTASGTGPLSTNGGTLTYTHSATDAGGVTVTSTVVVTYLKAARRVRNSGSFIPSRRTHS